MIWLTLDISIVDIEMTNQNSFRWSDKRNPQKHHKKTSSIVSFVCWKRGLSSNNESTLELTMPLTRVIRLKSQLCFVCLFVYPTWQNNNVFFLCANSLLLILDLTTPPHFEKKPEQYTFRSLFFFFSFFFMLGHYIYIYNTSFRSS